MCYNWFFISLDVIYWGVYFVDDFELLGVELNVGYCLNFCIDELGGIFELFI